MISEHALQVVRDYVGKAFEAGMPTFPHYTLHGRAHLDEVDRLAQEVALLLDLSPDRTNRLRLALALHDLAMVAVPDPARERELRREMTPEASFADVVRRTHQDEVRGALERGDVLAFLNRTILDPQELPRAVEVARHHRFHPLPGPDHPDRALCALVRVVDELDLGPGRAPLPAYEAMRERSDDLSRFHWIRHLVTSRISTDDLTLCIGKKQRGLTRLEARVIVSATATTWVPIQASVVAKLRKVLDEEGVNSVLRETLQAEFVVVAGTARDPADSPYLDAVLRRDLQALCASEFIESLPGGDREVVAYLEKLALAHGSVRLSGFRSEVRQPLDLEELHVPLGAWTSSCGIEDSCPGSSAEAAEARAAARAAEDVPLARAFHVAARDGRRGLVIVGNPGSGKTTHLKRLAMSVAQGRQAELGLPAGMVPVLVHLRLFGEKGTDLAKLIEASLDDDDIAYEEDLGERLAARRKLILLLDGLDEVSRPEERAAVSRWVEGLVDGHKEWVVAVTCRYAGYAGEVRLDERFLQLNVKPLDEEQVADFVKKWFRAAEGGEGHRRAEQKARTLIDRLGEPEFRSSARLAELSGTPLLLTAICLVHGSGRELPRHRGALYNECVDVLLERWRKEGKGLPVSVDLEAAKLVLEPVACWMHGEKERKRANEIDLERVIDKEAASLGGTLPDARTFLRTVRDESGLLTGWSGDTYGFLHLGFQEYLAAKDVLRRHQGGETSLAELASRFGDSWWEEVVLLVLGVSRGAVFGPFFKQVLEGDAFLGNRKLVDDCIQESRWRTAHPFIELLRMPPAAGEGLWRRQAAALEIVEQHFRESLQGLAPVLRGHPLPAIRRRFLEERRQAAVETVVRSGIDLVRVGGGEFWMGSAGGREGPRHQVQVPSFYLARTPVTNAQYGEFLKGNPTAPKPAFWADRRFNQSEQPVVGVDFDDAQAFCRWAGLRLPSEAEWEYSCRAGSEGEYCYGDGEETLGEYAWYFRNSGNHELPLGTGWEREKVFGEWGCRLHAVAGKRENGLGLFDMHGNVWEWCQDNWHKSYRRAPVDGRPWEGGGSPYRVFRGGSWRGPAVCCRSAYRYGWLPSDRLVDLGFRPALSD